MQMNENWIYFEYSNLMIFASTFSLRASSFIVVHSANERLFRQINSQMMFRKYKPARKIISIFLAPFLNIHSFVAWSFLVSLEKYASVAKDCHWFMKSGMWRERLKYYLSANLYSQMKRDETSSRYYSIVCQIAFFENKIPKILFGTTDKFSTHNFIIFYSFHRWCGSQFSYEDIQRHVSFGSLRLLRFLSFRRGLILSPQRDNSHECVSELVWVGY